MRLVYNPQGASLPPPQAQLEADYKAHLAEDFGIYFNNLLTITNQPIARCGSTLVSKGTFNSYMQLLRDSYRPENLDIGDVQKSGERRLAGLPVRPRLYQSASRQAMMSPKPPDQPGRGGQPWSGHELGHYKEKLQ
jgi:hypothetical protein